MKQLPKNLKPVITDRHRVVLAYGEVTDHAHGIYEPEKVELLESSDIAETQRYLNVKESVDLTHEEHTKHTLHPGIGDVRIQREWSLDGLRQVAD